MLRHSILLLLLFTGIAVNAQSPGFRFAFYNVENLFDTINNPNKEDDAFTPDGENHWNSYRYQTKLNHIYKTLMAVKGWENLYFIGLCEVENRNVLDHLLYKTPLYRFGYRILHQESPDERGIDVALLYREDKVTVNNTFFHPVSFPFDTTDKTRDILYTQAIVEKTDTLHVFVNHWPSRYGGYMQTQPKRKHTGKVLGNMADSILKAKPGSNIVLAGDFNDEPNDAGLKSLMDNVGHGSLTNLPLKPSAKGTTKYRSQWLHFDQIIVSQALLEPDGLHLQEKKLSVGNFPFLLKPDKRYQGKEPWRFYLGPKYEGGYSDHLPIFIDIRKTK